MSLSKYLPGILGQQAAPAGGPLWVADFSGTGAYSDSDVSVLNGSFSRSSGDLVVTADWTSHTLEIDGPTYGDDQWVKVTMGSGGSSLIIGCFLCLNQTLAGGWSGTDSGNGYTIGLGSDGDTPVARALYISGSWTHSFGTVGWSSGDVLELRRVANGSDADLSFWINAVQQGSTYTHTSALSGGHPAFGAHTAASTNDAAWSAASSGDEANT